MNRVLFSWDSYPTMTRFFAHLCLYLQLMEIPVPPLATQIILEAYLQVLEVFILFFCSNWKNGLIFD
jgi:hypothetical protein